MLENIKTTLLTAIISLTYSISANAIELNIKLGDDILHNQDKLNIVYELYFSKASSVSQTIRGQAQNVFSMWLEAFNRENKDMKPINNEINNKSSFISLGYNKNDVSYFPASCQRIILTNVSSITLSLTENGCTVL